MREILIRIVVMLLGALVGAAGSILIARVFGLLPEFLNTPQMDYLLSASGVVAAALLVLLSTIFVSSADLKRALSSFVMSFGEFVGSVIGVSVASSLSEGSTKVDRLLEALENERLKGAALSSSAEQKVVHLFEQALKTGLDDKIRRAINSLVRKQIPEETYARALKILVEGQNRLAQAAKSVSIRGFVNLAIGIIFAASALVVLKSAVDLVDSEDLSRLTLSQAVYVMGVRISLALVITLIAYFFLAIYKRSLDDVRYYQNELTFLDLAATAVAVSYDAKPDGVGAKVAQALLSSSRAGAPAEENRGDHSAAVASRILEKLVDKLPGQST